MVVISWPFPSQHLTNFPSFAFPVISRSINTNFMPILRDKEVLAFVDRIIFNAADVVLEEKTGVDGSCEASGGIKSAFLAFLKIFLQVSRMAKGRSCGHSPELMCIAWLYCTGN